MQLLQRDIRMKPVRVLVADDDAVFRSLVCSNLDGHADSVSEAEDGQRAWELLVGETFELALIDLSMPGIDGYALIRCIRSHPRTRRLPILVITSTADPVAVKRALEAGATSFLAKPINWNLFGHHIDYMIRVEQTNSIERFTKQRAEAVARAKDALIATLAARVRGQTRKMVAASEVELWRRPPDDGQSLDFAAGVLADARELEETLDQVLPFVRSMTEQIVVDDRLVSIERLIEACVERLQLLAAKGDVTIDIARIPSSMRVRCDEPAMSRAVGNLLQNAIEFTTPGTTVRVGIELREDFVLSINIDDDGPGVDPDVIARCLKPLDQREGHETSAPDQAALGLPIAKAIAQAHGGTVEVMPRSPTGTRASLIVPAELVEAKLDDVA